MVTTGVSIKAASVIQPKRYLVPGDARRDNAARSIAAIPIAAPCQRNATSATPMACTTTLPARMSVI